MENNNSHPVSTNPADFRTQWSKFQACFESNEIQLAAELSACRDELQNLLDTQSGELRGPVSRISARPACAEYAAQRNGAADTLLYPVAAKRRSRGEMHRVFRALEDYRRGLQDALAYFPESGGVPRYEIAKAFGDLPGSRFAAWLLMFRKEPSSVRVREAAMAAVHQALERRERLDRKFFTLALKTARIMRAPWEIVRSSLDTAVAEDGSGDLCRGKRIERLDAKLRTIILEAESSLGERHSWSAGAPARIARRTLWNLALRRREADKAEFGVAAHLSRWSAVLRTLDAEEQLDYSLEKFEREILNLAARTIHSLEEELHGLLADMDWAIERLNRPAPALINDDFPVPKTDIVPAANRLAEFEGAARILLEELPESCEIVPRPASGSHQATRNLQPRKMFQSTYARVGREQLRRLFERAAERHARLFQEIERAREVVAFSRESVESANLSLEAACEAARNARMILQFQRERLHVREIPSPELASALARVFNENRLILGQRRMSTAAYLAQYGIRRTWNFLLAAAGESLRSSADVAGQTLKKRGNQFLISIGWKEKPTAGALEVITRPYLPAEITIDLSSKELPEIYRYLFRFEPIQDARFLVGREQEMAAIEEVRDLWLANRPAAVLLAGPRGSGKTSLINCVLKQALSGLETVRGEFGRRITSKSEMRGFLASLLDCDDGDGLERTLLDRRRLIVIEELERCYLRKIGGYGAIRELQRIIAGTCTRTLWVIAVNDVAFQFLDASVSLGRTFSHRINAGTATPDNLRNAIMLRHNLSGLRLQFPPVPVNGRKSRKPSQHALEKSSPAEYFFARLAKESGGAFRAAFELWLGHIDCAHAGTMYMKSMDEADLSHVIEGLSQDEIFTLAAGLQHGSLTVDEHSRIFQKRPCDSRTIVDSLHSREILELDPGRDGFRIRPEASRVVRETLYKRNLISW